MEDKEIIKALECCNDGWNCESCAFDDEDESMSECTSKLAKAALDLIQRQQERMDRLKDNLDAVLAERATLDVDMVIEKLKEKSYGFEDLEYIDLDTAMAIVQGGANDDR